MFDIICVTNRRLCEENFISRVRSISEAKPSAIILREKDLTKTEYGILAEEIREICRVSDTRFIIHSFPETAKELGCKNLHMPLPMLRNMKESDKEYFSELGSSCHSISEAVEAEKLGCSYIVAGNIFATDCKKGLPGRGIEFLENVCQSVSIPVFAIGGIRENNISEIRRSGANGACIMSGFMQCENPKEFLTMLRQH